MIRGERKEDYLGKLFDQGAIDRVDQRTRYLQSTNVSHFPNPVLGDTALSPNQKNQRRFGKSAQPVGAAANYREGHEVAMQIAYANGVNHAKNDDALLADAFACHFLTDSFSASHIRTARHSIKEYWDAKVPDFQKKLIGWLADLINKQPLGALTQTLVVGQFIPVLGAIEGIGAEIFGKDFPASTVRAEAVRKLSILLQHFSFGDAVSLIVHDAEGAMRVQATIEGSPITLVGDKDLVSESAAGKAAPGTGAFVGGGTLYSLLNTGDAGQTAKAATAAVKASIEDIEAAYSAGWFTDPSPTAYAPGFTGRDPFPKKQSFDEFRKAALGKRSLYRAELLVPTPVEDTHLPPGRRSLNWKMSSADVLLSDPAFQTALAAFGRAEGPVFAEQLKNLRLLPQHEAALRTELVNPLKGGNAKEIARFLKKILSWGG
jgi:hypothetical protein